MTSCIRSWCALPEVEEVDQDGEKKKRLKFSMEDEYKAWFPSQLVFWWPATLVLYGAQNFIEMEDLGQLGEPDRAGKCADELWGNLQGSNVLSAMSSTYGPYLMVAWAGKIVGDLVGFVQPIALSQYLLEMEFAYKNGSPRLAPGTEVELVWLWALAMVLSSLLQNLLMHFHHHIAMKLGLRLRSALRTLVFRKSATLAPSSRDVAESGEVVNLQSVDAMRMTMLLHMGVYWVTVPIQVAIAAYLLYDQLGWPGLVGLVLLFLQIPIQRYIGSAIQTYIHRSMSEGDTRLKYVNEVIQGIRAVKMNAWEDTFEKRIEDARDKELGTKLIVAEIEAFNSTVADGTPLLVALVVFLVFVGTEGVLTPSITFTTISLIDILRLPLFIIPMVTSLTFSAFSSASRLDWFFTLPDAKEYVVIERDLDAKRKGGDKDGEGEEVPAVEFKDVSLQFNNPDGDPLPLSEYLNKDNDGEREEAKEGEEEEKDEEKGLPETSATSTPFAMTDLTFKLPAHKLTTIVGTVGAGKSAILRAMLGNMHLTKGVVRVRFTDPAPDTGIVCRADDGRRCTKTFLPNDVAYCPQDPFIINATVRNNILFGLKMDRDRYEQTLDACQLRTDLEILPGGDQCEIGPRGVSLSGGQQARIGLARAVYSNANMILLDDVLSAVDAETGLKLFNQVIRGVLADRTVIFASHQMHFLRFSDYVLVLDNGRVVETGPPSSLLDRSSADESSALSRILAAADVSDDIIRAAGAGAGAADEAAPTRDEVDGGEGGEGGGDGAGAGEEDVKVSVEEEEEKKEAEEGGGGGQADDDARAVQGKLVEKEARSRGKVSLSTWMTYINALGAMSWTGIIVSVSLSTVASIMSTWWLARWGTDAYGETLAFYMGIYAGLAVLGVLTIFVYQIVWAKASIEASRDLHHTMTEALVRAPTSFFDATPTGRITSRFGNDIEQLDRELPKQFAQFVKSVFLITAAIILQAVVVPLAIVGFIPIAIIYYAVQKLFRNASREVKRLDNISQGPIFSLLAEALQGISTVQAYNHTDRIAQDLENAVDKNGVAYWASNSMNRWLGLRIEWLGGMVIASTAFASAAVAGSVDPGIAGLAVSYALSITTLLNWTIRSGIEAETRVTSAERVLELAEVPPEAPHTVEEAEKRGVEVIDVDASRKDVWPEHGELTIHNLRMRYRPQDDLVLRGLDLDIKAGERIGVCGRTGSGKSSLMVALFRTVESEDGTEITVDGVNLRRLPLHTLRRGLTIILQDPFLAKGTVRYNLDPTNSASSDDELWSALERAQLKAKIEEIGGLDADIADGGSNLSKGQKQLLCIARAIIRKPRVLILDEPSASVDSATDAELQRVLRTSFPGVTMLTIAHRLDTIADSDRVLVLGKGKIIEFDKPSKLLEDKDSAFSALIREAQGHEKQK